MAGALRAADQRLKSLNSWLTHLDDLLVRLDAHGNSFIDRLGLGVTQILRHAQLGDLMSDIEPDRPVPVSPLPFLPLVPSRLIPVARNSL